MATALLTTSCLGDDDDVTLYDDAAITSFTLGTLNRYVTTTLSSGRDTTYKVSYAGSGYKMHIDQTGRHIFNSDSLPTGTDVSHVLCTIVTRNNGAITLKSPTSDSVMIYSSTDSLDFSQPCVLSIFSSDGRYRRDYTVTLNLRCQEPGELRWTDMTGQVPVADYQIVSYPEISQVVGYAIGEVYGYGWDGKLKVSSDQGMTWTDERLDSPEALLPRERTAFVSWAADNGVQYALMAGRVAQTDTAMTIWRKIIDQGREGHWVLMTQAEDNPYYLPTMEQVALVRYRGMLLALGSNGLVYKSRDQGITWMTSSKMVMPAIFRNTPFKAWTSPSSDDPYQKDGSAEFLWLQDSAWRTWRGIVN